MQENKPLRHLVNLKTGGLARYFIDTDNISELIEAVNFAARKKLPVFVLGGGTNVLVSDNGFQGVVLKINSNNYSILGDKVFAEAGQELDYLVDASVHSGLKGLEWAAGIPGTLGGAIRGNAGAFGSSISDVVEEVEVLSLEKEPKIKKRSKNECLFGYRSSIFKQNNEIILSAVLSLSKEDNISGLIKDISARREYRKSSHPLEFPNLGSYFKNITDQDSIELATSKMRFLKNDLENKWHGKIPAGKIIEICGLSGKNIGGARVSEKHCNFLVNYNDARSDDFIILSSLIKHKARDFLGIQLTEEIELLGFDQ